jgi:hypothetical protein
MSERELLRLGGIPVYQNKAFTSAATARACPCGELVLSQDASTGLVRNIAFDPGLLEYDGSYQNEQGNSPAFRAHVADVLALVERHFGSMDILEIGCGKGRFLEAMLAAGHDARGVDAAYEGGSDRVTRSDFGPGLGIRGDAIVMRHVLEHIPSPLAFLQMVRDANGGHGRIYIEVPCLDWILRHKAWFDIFYEHVNYFRLDDFDRMFGRVIDSGRLFGGQYLYAVAELDSLRDPALAPRAPREASVPADFFGSLDRCAAAVDDPAHCAIWGAAAKGVMFAHHMQARGALPALAIDINPAKRGSFLAGTALPVLAPAQAMAGLGHAPRVFVMNSNYIAEIRAMGGTGPDYIEVDKT